ncbi:MAG: lytic transglycosylase domain-containing protein [Flavobacteriales bacterium]|jgi:membrane-bound lytic murein transglycosylase D
MRLFLSKILIFISVFFLSCEAEGQKQEESKSESRVEHFQMPKLPDSIVFAGELIDFTDWDLKERLDKELHAIVYYHNLIIPYLKRSTRFLPELERLMKENNLPDDFKYLAIIESGLENVTSPSGAQGFWQFLPGTASEYGMTISEYIDERNDLAKSTPAAAKYIIDAKDSMGSWVDAAASYNRGVSGLKKDKKWQEAESYFDTYMNNETGRYVFRILAMKLIFEDPMKYGYDLSTIQQYEPFETKSKLVEEGIPDVAQWSKGKGYNYKIVRKLNPWIIGNRLPNRTGGYTILLPANDEHFSNYKD